MGETLADIAMKLGGISAFAKQIVNKPKQVAGAAMTPKIQLIYAFNGTGKTRLSREFKQAITCRGNSACDLRVASNSVSEGDVNLIDNDDADVQVHKVLYYNAFTEDLFYWDNDLEHDAEPLLKIQPNTFTDWILQEQGQDQNVITNFQRYVNSKLTPCFNSEYEKDGKHEGTQKRIKVKAFSEVKFTLETGDESHLGNLKISKGEESCFVWSMFYTLLEQIIANLNIAEPVDRETDVFNELEYVFIDDPVSSLDDNHLIDLAVDLATLIKSNTSDLKFIVTTHNPLFFNVLVNELGSDDNAHSPTWKARWFAKYRLLKLEDGTYELVSQPNDSPFAYHLHLLAQLKSVVDSGTVEKHHFNHLRQILEKAATFLGYNRWEQLLPQTEDGRPNLYAKRILNFRSHYKHAADETATLAPHEQKILKTLIDHIISKHGFK